MKTLKLLKRQKKEDLLAQDGKKGGVLMFIDFFYKLRDTGLDVSVNEWLTVMEALRKGLCKSSLTEFYHVCRAIVVRSESEFDKFDTAFADYFKDIKKFDEIPKEIYEFLENPKAMAEDFDKLAADLRNGNLTLEDLQRLLRERLEEQKERHDGGIYWIGTGGGSTMGHSGYSPKGIRVGGEGRLRSALQMAGEHNYKDFRDDNILDTRQLQVAFRRLRQFSSRVEGPKTELDVEKTIQKTCDNAGRLKLVFDRPRQNTVKLVVLFDSGGSMHRYSQMCSALFQAVSKSNHFKDLKIYYFHNCIYDQLYTTPECRYDKSVETNWVLRNLNKDYKIIFVGDAAMSPTELLSVGGNYYYGVFNEEPGIEWIRKFKNKYKNVVWLNPIAENRWIHTYGYDTIRMISKEVDMYELTVSRMEYALKKLIASK